MVKWKWLDDEKLLLFLLVVMAAAVRTLFLLKFDNMPGDATGNVERALCILGDPGLRVNFDGNTSTLYKYMIASLMYFWRDPVLAPRAFTALFGIFLLIPYYGTLKVLFDRTIAFLSSLVLVFYPLHIVQSSVTTSDAVYYFFLFSAFYYFFSFKSGQGRKSALGLSAFYFNIAALLRFESWTFIPLFFLLLWPKGKKTALLFLALSVISPCISLLLNKIIDHDFFYTFNAASRTAYAEIKAGVVPYDPSPWSWLTVLWRSTGPSVVIGGLCGIALAFLTRQRRHLSVFFLVIFSAFTVSSCAERMWHHQRYSIILALFLIPYAWFLVDRVLTLFRVRKKIFFLLILIFPLVDFWQVPFVAMPSMLCFTPPAVRNVAAWLKANVRPDETLIIDADLSNAYPANILIRSGIPSQRGLILWRPNYGKERFETKEAFGQYLWAHRPRYLVLNSEGQIRKIMHFDPTAMEFSFENALFRVMNDEDLPNLGKYTVYRVSYGKLPRSNENG